MEEDLVTNQRDEQREEPSVDEEIISSDLYDVQEQRAHRQQDALGHCKLLHCVLQEKTQRLGGRKERN